MKVFAVLRNLDTTAGNGPMILAHICEDKKSAEKLSLFYEPYGRQNQFNEVKEFEVLNMKAVNLITVDKEELENLEKSPEVKRYLELQKLIKNRGY